MAAPSLSEPGVKGECDRELEWKEAARRDPKALCSLAFWQIRQPFQPRGNHFFRRPLSLEGTSPKQIITMGSLLPSKASRQRPKVTQLCFSTLLTLFQIQPALTTHLLKILRGPLENPLILSDILTIYVIPKRCYRALVE